MSEVVRIPTFIEMYPGIIIQHIPSGYWWFHPNDEFTLRSVRIVVSNLRNQVNSIGCKLFVNYVKLAISETEPFHYPALVVTCDSRDKKATQYIQYPSLIIEVLSVTVPAAGVSFQERLGGSSVLSF